MGANCCGVSCSTHDEVSSRYRKVLWAALGINAAMFGVEIIGGFKSGSVSLLADAADFLGDAANYGLTLAVLSHGLLWRARAALVKGLTMGAIAFVALMANGGVAVMLAECWRGPISSSPA